MKKIQMMIAVMLSVMLLVFASCSKDNELTSTVNGEGTTSGETVISKTGGTKSHNAGNNCMNCHVKGGGGEGTFVAAGTAYKSGSQSVYPNAIVMLTTQANGAGTVRATLYGDANGNFYTTAPIDFTGGLFPMVKGTSGNVTYMTSPVTSAACNSCHGSSTSKISVF